MAEGAPLPLGLVGATGRLGTAVRAALGGSEFALGCVLARDAARAAALQATGLPATADAAAFCAQVTAIVDCSAPPQAARLLPLAAARGLPYLLASTGLGAPEQQALQAAGRTAAVLPAANLSRGIALLQQWVRQAATALPDFTVQISELHHRHKRDAPSGTALALGEAAGVGAAQCVALRGGDAVGEHTVYFLGEGERLELTHRSSSPALFAQGALRALRFLRQAAPGRYSMADVLQASDAAP